MKTSHILIVGGIVGFLVLCMYMRGGGALAPTMPPNKAIPPAPPLPLVSLSDPATGKVVSFGINGVYDVFGTANSFPPRRAL